MGVFTRLWFALTHEPGRARRKGTFLPYSKQERDATSRIADVIVQRLLDYRLKKTGGRAGAMIVHYAVGTATGASYAILARRFPEVRKFCGVPFGVAVWLIADELVMPALGTTRKLRDYSRQAQINALGEHIVYAITVDSMLNVESQFSL
jgi:putative membrane protein